MPNPVTESAAVFLWGARQTGKMTFLRDNYPDARFYDLLDTTLSAELIVRSQTLREEILAERPGLVVIDEVRAFLEYKQLDHPISFWQTSSGFEVDLIIGNRGLAVECLSARKIMRAQYHIRPLVS